MVAIKRVIFSFILVIACLQFVKQADASACLLEPEVGFCRAAIERWFYDQDLKVTLSTFHIFSKPHRKLDVLTNICFSSTNWYRNVLRSHGVGAVVSSHLKPSRTASTPIVLGTVVFGNLMLVHVKLLSPVGTTTRRQAYVHCNLSFHLRIPTVGLTTFIMLTKSV